MKKLVLIILIISVAFAFSQQNKSRLNELERKSQLYIEQGNYRKAIAALEEADKLQKSGSQLKLTTTDNIPRASRFVKLAQTYINNGDYGKAFENLEKARKIIGNRRSWDAQYWLAAIDEAYGTAYKKMNFSNEARRYLTSALNTYNRLISMPEGSPDAVRILISNIENELSNINSATGSSVLNFDNQKLRQLPANLPSNLQNISLVQNRLRSFPTEFTNYKNLQVINLSKNILTDVKFDFSNLKYLKYLDLSDNKIKSLDENIANATSLEYLNLSNNKLKNIPMSLTKLKNLKVLNLKGNKLQFSTIKTLIQSMPYTNILHDEYIQKGDENLNE